MIGGDTRGAVIGGAIGGAAGAHMAAQERELRQSLAGSGAAITNTGSDLRVILPESVTFRTGSPCAVPPDAAGNLRSPPQRKGSDERHERQEWKR